MLGLIGTVVGASALELKRLRKRGSLEELKEIKQRERELRALLEATSEELERVKAHSDEVAATNTALAAQKETLAANNSRLVITNLLLLNKAKTLEEHSRALVAKHDDLQHQLEALRRDQADAAAGFEAGLSALKEQVTAVLRRYFGRDIDLAGAVAEMQAMGIDVVAPEELSRRGGDAGAMEFETKLVLESPQRMQRLACAGSMRAQQLTAMPHDSDVLRLGQVAFPLGICRDPATGAPRITLAWRTPAEPQPAAGAAAAAALTAAPDSARQAPDQRQQQAGKRPTAGALPCAAKAADAGELGAARDGKSGALSFGSPAKQQQQQQKAGGRSGAAFSLAFGGFGGGSARRAGARSGAARDAASALQLTGGMNGLKGDDDLFATGAGSRDLVAR